MGKILSHQYYQDTRKKIDVITSGKLVVFKFVFCVLFIILFILLLIIGFSIRFSTVGGGQVCSHPFHNGFTLYQGNHKILENVRWMFLTINS